MAGQQKPRRLKVRATRTGYYDLARRRAGDVFVVEEAAFAETWMERVSSSTPEQISTAQSSINAQTATKREPADTSGLEEI
jgi:hypothetical protein